MAAGTLRLMQGAGRARMLTSLAPQLSPAWLAPPVRRLPANAVVQAPQMRQMSVFSRFRDALRREIAKEKEFQQDLEELKDHETTKKAKQAARSVADSAAAASEKVKTTAGTVSQEVLKPAAKAVADPIAKQAKAAAQVASRVGESVGERVDALKQTEHYQRTSKMVQETSRQVEQTRVARAMSSAVSTTREALDKERREREGGAYFDTPPEDAAKPQIREEDLNTEELGIVVVAEPKSALEKHLEKLAGSGPIKRVLSHKVVGAVVGGVSDAASKAARVADAVSERVFPESEGGEVISRIRQRDPKFSLFPFVNFLRDHVCREVVQAFLDGDLEYLRKKCGDKAFAVLSATIKARAHAGLRPDNRILAVTQVEFQKAILSDDDKPTVLISFVCQQVNASYNSKGEVAEGSEDDIRAVYYVWALQPDEKFADLRWRIAEMAIHGSLKLLS